MTYIPRTNFHSPYISRHFIKFGFDWQAVSEEKIFEIVGQTMDDNGRTMEALVYIKLTREPSAQVCQKYRKIGLWGGGGGQGGCE